ncbi:MAG: hypothetical protein FWB73_00085 [Treponema sp.]|nr:hypothetical protein [Treponema sp.]
MIKQQTARNIYNCYSEIINAEKILKEIEDEEKKEKERNENTFDRSDLTNREYYYELGIPSFSNRDSHRIYHLKPTMAKAVLSVHIGDQKARLVELNQIAKLEAEEKEYCGDSVNIPC